MIHVVFHFTRRESIKRWVKQEAWDEMMKGKVQAVAIYASRNDDAPRGILRFWSLDYVELEQ